MRKIVSLVGLIPLLIMTATGAQESKPPSKDTRDADVYVSKRLEDTKTKSVVQEKALSILQNAHSVATSNAALAMLALQIQVNEGPSHVGEPSTDQYLNSLKGNSDYATSNLLMMELLKAKDTGQETAVKDALSAYVGPANAPQALNNLAAAGNLDDGVVKADIKKAREGLIKNLYEAAQQNHGTTCGENMPALPQQEPLPRETGAESRAARFAQSVQTIREHIGADAAASLLSWEALSRQIPAKGGENGVGTINSSIAGALYNEKDAFTWQMVADLVKANENPATRAEARAALVQFMGGEGKMGDTLSLLDHSGPLEAPPGATFAQQQEWHNARVHLNADIGVGVQNILTHHGVLMNENRLSDPLHQEEAPQSALATPDRERSQVG